MNAKALYRGWRARDNVAVTSFVNVLSLVVFMFKGKEQKKKEDSNDDYMVLSRKENKSQRRDESGLGVDAAAKCVECCEPMRSTAVPTCYKRGAGCCSK